MRRSVTLVFQRPILLSGTVRWNVEFGLRLRRAANRPERINRILRQMGLEGLATRRASALSGGEAQMVALARAIVLETDVLLLDEPTNGLDPARVAAVESVVGAETQDRGVTVVWATHNLFQARRLADRVALLLDGRLVEVGPTQKVFEAPDDPKTAQFVRGEMVC
jgi:tungstate transport system ATP-binding protein